MHVICVSFSSKLDNFWAGRHTKTFHLGISSLNSILRTASIHTLLNGWVKCNGAHWQHVLTWTFWILAPSHSAIIAFHSWCWQGMKHSLGRRPLINVFSWGCSGFRPNPGASPQMGNRIWFREKSIAHSRFLPPARWSKELPRALVSPSLYSKVGCTHTRVSQNTPNGHGRAYRVTGPYPKPWAQLGFRIRILRVLER